MRGTTEMRLARIEAGCSVGPPTAILTDRPIGDVAGDLATADAFTNWQRWVAQGKATVRNGVLCLVGAELSADEWAARFVTGY